MLKSASRREGQQHGIRSVQVRSDMIGATNNWGAITLAFDPNCRRRATQRITAARRRLDADVYLLQWLNTRRSLATPCSSFVAPGLDSGTFCGKNQGSWMCPKHLPALTLLRTANSSERLAANPVLSVKSESRRRNWLAAFVLRCRHVTPPGTCTKFVLFSKPELFKKLSPFRGHSNDP